MGLRASAHMILVTPTGDNSERQVGALFVASSSAQTPVLRGVVEHVGEHIPEPLVRGNVVHYQSYIELGDKHLVPQQHLLAYEDDE